MLHTTEPPVEIDVISEYTTVTFILSGEQNMRLGDRSFMARISDMLFILFRLPISSRFLPQIKKTCHVLQEALYPKMNRCPLHRIIGYGEIGFLSAFQNDYRLHALAVPEIDSS